MYTLAQWPTHKKRFLNPILPDLRQPRDIFLIQFKETDATFIASSFFLYFPPTVCAMPVCLCQYQSAALMECRLPFPSYVQ